MKIGVFTDIHYRSKLDAGMLDPDKSLGAGLDHLTRFVKDLDLIVITGDLAHEGEVEAYQILQKQLQRFDIKFQLLIGNHDRRENFLSVFSNTETDENGFVQSFLDTSDHRLIFLDTLYAPPYDYPLSHMGNMCDQRLAWLGQALSSAGENPCIIFMHHPPHKTGFVAMDSIRLSNGDEFYEMVEKYQNVKHIFCGHVHRNISGCHRGIPFNVFKSTVGQMPMLFDEMNFHMECFEAPAYSLIELSKEGVVVQTEDYGLTDLDELRTSLSPK